MIFNLLRGRRLNRLFSIGVVSALVGLSLLSTQALALSVGRIQVSSFLNEPFRATVPLSSLQSGELDQLRVRLADDKAYASLGLEKSRFLTSLKFTTREGSAPDSAVVAITSSQVVKEPYFSFLLEFRGLGGRIIREYTVLLDPNTGQRRAQAQPTPVGPTRTVPLKPVPQATPAPRVQPPRNAPQPQPRRSQPVRSAPQPAPAPQPRAAVQAFRGGDAERKVAVPSPEVFLGTDPDIQVPAVAPTSAPRRPAANEYGPVAAGMTLWQIAEAVRPSDSLSINQVMWALYSSNEDQFDGNLNLILRDAMLKVPSAQAMRNVSPGEAAALVADQAEQHAQLLQRLRDQAQQAAGPERVSLEPIATAEPVLPRRAAATPEPEPMFEPMDEAADESEMAELPALAEPEDRPVELVDEASEPELPELPQNPADDTDVALNEEFEELEALPQDDASGFEDSADYADLPPLPEDAGGADLDEEVSGTLDSTPQLPLDDSEGSGLLTWLLGALGVLVAVVAGLFVMRRRGQSADGDKAVSDFADAQPAARSVSDYGLDTSDVTTKEFPAVGADQTADMDAAADATGDFGAGDHPEETDLDIPDLDTLAAADDDQVEPDFGDTAIFNAAEDQGVEFGDTEIKQGPSSEDAGPASFDMADEPAEDDLDGGTQTLDLGSETVSLELNEDPVSEADFQLAYGLYDEAALLLNRAIENDPSRMELHEKLAETYFAASDAEKFKAAAQSLKTRNPDADTWQRIAIMGQQLCPDDAQFAGDLAGGGSGSLDLDMDFESGDDSAGGSDDAMSLDFDMPTSVDASPTVSEPASADEHVLEFDMDDGMASADSGTDDALSLEPAGTQPAAKASADSNQDEFGLGEDDFDADFGSLDEVEVGDEDLPELDDLDLGDLEAELESDVTASDDPLAGDTIAMEVVEPEAPAADAAVATETADDFADLTLSDVSDTELGLDSEIGDAGEVLGVGTDFDLDAESLDEAASTAEETNFELDDLATDEPEAAADSAADFELADSSEDAGTATDFELDALSDDAGAEQTDFSLDDMGLDSEDAVAAAESTDFDLDELGDASSDDSAAETADELSLTPSDDAATTDFNLDELAADSASTDFDLEDVSSDDAGGDFDLGELDDEPASELDLDDADDLSLDNGEAASEATDFDLGDLGVSESGEATDFDLGGLDDDGSAPEVGNVTDFDLDNPVGEQPAEATAEETDFDLDDLGGSTDFNLDEAASDAGDISGGDEAGTKLDLARAYVDMGESDMARSLLEEVSQSGSDAQKTEAQELLGKL